MAKFSVLSKQCPVCNGTSVKRIEGRWGFRSPTHRCPDCKAELKTAFSAAAFWFIPIAVATFGAMYFAIVWLQQSQVVTGLARAALIGGVVGLATALPANVALRGIVFRPSES